VPSYFHGTAGAPSSCGYTILDTDSLSLSLSLSLQVKERERECNRKPLLPCDFNHPMADIDRIERLIRYRFS